MFFGEECLAEDELAGGGDGEALRKGINVGHFMEQFTEFEGARRRMSTSD